MQAAQKALGNIAVVVDERVSRERAQIVARALNALRQHATITLLAGSTTEDDLIRKMEAQPFSLVLLPWHKYLAWSKAEAFYGLTRTSGPTVAGYLAEPIQPTELGNQADHLRAILLDFAHMSTSEALHFLKALAVDHQRTGIRPLHEPSTPVYSETWYTPLGIGTRMESILALPEVANSDWASRAATIRILLLALSQLVFEEGPGKGEFAQTVTARSPKAYFQFAADRQAVTMRICYTMSAWTPKDALKNFWPDEQRPSSAPQLLGRFADFIRVHPIAETSDVEVVVGLLPSAPAEKGPAFAHTLWVEPIALQLVSEAPSEAPSPDHPNLRALPGAPPPPAAQRPESIVSEEELRAKDRFIFNAALKIKQMKRELEEKEDIIRELRSGGIGTAPPLPPPDAESLLQAFQERYGEAKYEIRQLELQIQDAEASGASPAIVEQIRRRIAALMQQERHWIKTLATTLEMFRDTRRPRDGSGG